MKTYIALYLADDSISMTRDRCEESVYRQFLYYTLIMDHVCFVGNQSSFRGFMVSRDHTHLSNKYYYHNVQN